MKGVRILCCPDRISWIVETHGVLLIDTFYNRTTLLSTAEAAIWDLLTRNRSRERLLTMLVVITGQDTQSVAFLLDACLDRWLKEGWLAVGDEL